MTYLAVVSRTNKLTKLSFSVAKYWNINTTSL